MKTLLCLAFSLLSIPAIADPLTGRVADETGRPVPRALVRVFDGAGRVVAEVFTLTDGTFSATVPAGECRVEVSLSGFSTANVPCSTSTTVTLPVAPLQEAVVVTAHRSETPASQVAASVNVIAAEEIARRQHPPVADLLVTTPGATVSRSGGYGNVTSLFVRGGESNYNKVLLDGIPMNEPGGTFNFGSLTSENLDRVEVVRGAHSALFGSDAMTSVIQLFTRRAIAGQPPQVSGAFAAGSYDTWRAQAAVRGASAGFDYSIGAAHFVTDNRVPNNRFVNDTIAAAAGQQLGARAMLRAVFRAEIGSAGTPGQTAFGRPDMDAEFDRRDLVGGVTFLQEVTPALRHRVTYGLAATRQTSANLERDAPYTPSFEGRTAPFEFSDFLFHSRNTLRRHYASYQADWTVGRTSTSRGVHQLTGAVDWEGERGTLEDLLAESGTGVSRDNFGVTLQHQASWPRLFATAGVRLERNESFGTATAPRGSVAVLARRTRGAFAETKLKASAGRGIKEPTALQTFSRSPFFLGNPELEPEEAVSFEVGVEQRLGGDRARVEVTWFDNRFTNIIATRTISFSPFRSQYFNIGRTEARGLELVGAVAPRRGMQARAGYTLLDSEVTESRTPNDPVFGLGKPLFRRPRHSGFVVISADAGETSFAVTGLFVGRRTDSDFAALEPAITENAGYATWDADASVRLTRLLTFTIGVHNIGNSDHLEPLGYRSLGRRATVGLRIASGR